MSLPYDPKSPERILYVLRFPLRVTTEETAVWLNMHVDGVNDLLDKGEIPAIADKLNGKRMVDPEFLLKMQGNTRWLAKITRMEAQRVDAKNVAQAARKAAREAAKNKERA